MISDISSLRKLWQGFYDRAITAFPWVISVITFGFNVLCSVTLKLFFFIYLDGLNSSSDAALIAPLPPTSFLFLYALFHRLKGSLQHMVFCHTDIDLKSDLSACMKSEEAGLRNLGDGTLDDARSIDKV